MYAILKSNFMHWLQEDDDAVPPIDGETTTTPVDSEWPMPGEQTTRPPPVWGPPSRATADPNDGGDAENGEGEATDTTTRRRSSIGYVE